MDVVNYAEVSDGARVLLQRSYNISPEGWTLSWNHRIALVGRDLKDHQASTPCHRQSHQPPHLILGQAAQGPIQPGLEHLQERGIHSLSGQPETFVYPLTSPLSLFLSGAEQLRWGASVRQALLPLYVNQDLCYMLLPSTVFLPAPAWWIHVQSPCHCTVLLILPACWLDWNRPADIQFSLRWSHGLCLL